jgi:hypothetical protein
MSNEEEAAENFGFVIPEELELPPFLAPGPKMAKGQGAHSSCGDFCHPFPDKHTDKSSLSPETGTEQPDPSC